MAAHNELGKRGEALATELLQAKGYHLLDQSYRFERAEIDLVMLKLEPGELVFVEVKTRSQDRWGAPELAVDQRKQQQMFKAAEAYIHEKQMRTVPVRFDVVAVNLADPEEPVFHHIVDAFRMMERPWRALALDNEGQNSDILQNPL